MDQRQRNLGAVLAGGAGAAHLRACKIVLRGAGAEQRGLAGDQVEPLDTTRSLLLVDLHQQMIVGAKLPPEPHPYRPAQIDGGANAPVQVTDRDPAVEIVEMLGDDPVREHLDVIERMLALGNDVVPAVRLEVGLVEAHQPPVGRVQRGQRVVGGADAIERPELGDAHREYLGDVARLLERRDVVAALLTGAGPRQDLEDARLQRGLDMQVDVAMRRQAEDHAVGGLRLSQPVEEDHLAQAIPPGRIAVARIARIEEAASVRMPGDRRVLAVRQRVAQIEISIDVADAQRLLVTTGLRNEIGDALAEAVGHGVGQRHRAVGREAVGIDDGVARSGKMALPAVAALVGEPVVVEMEVARAAAMRNSHAGIVEHHIEQLADRRARRQRIEIGAAALILCRRSTPSRPRGLNPPAARNGSRTTTPWKVSEVSDSGGGASLAGTASAGVTICANAGRATASTPVATPPAINLRRVV